MGAQELLPRYLAAQLAGDRREAVRLVVEEGLKGGLSARSIHLDVVAEAQREIGRLWQENRISVADEHQATAISQVVLSHLYGALERAPRLGKRVVVACVPGELHDMSARMASDLLESYGFDVAFLGASVPIPALLGKLRTADALALSVTMTFHIGAAREVVAEVRAALGERYPIVVGGEAAKGLVIDGARISHGSALDLAAALEEVLRV